MLPPASPISKVPVEEFAHLSNQLHAEWAERLRAETGIDTGYRRCGAIYVAHNEQSRAELQETAERSRKQGIQFDELNRGELTRLEPALETAVLLAAYHVPGECQLRNPHHLRALMTACEQCGVRILAETPVDGFSVRGNAIEGVQTPQGILHAEQFCITSGTWSALVAAQLDLRLSIKPIRGQIALLKLPTPPFQRIINDGPRYLVPRVDGRVLIGSTMEDVGFDTSTTREGIDGLLLFARSLAPVLAGATLEAEWAGLRPASADGNPYLARMPELNNCFIAAGHTRSGLHLSPATAVTMAQLMCGEAPGVDLTPYRIDR